MNVLIIEDEDLAVRKLRKLIVATDPSLIIQGVTGSIEDSVIWLRENGAPDLILMDIELSDGQSFEIFNQVEVHSYLIFTTSYDEHVLPAFRQNFFDYLLKPILKDEFTKSLKKFRESYSDNEREGKGFPAINLESLVNELKKVQKSDD